MQVFAARKQIWINLGSIAVDAPDGRILNRGIMLDDTGAIRGRCDKIHLFDIQLSKQDLYRESASVTPGDEAVIHDTPFGGIGHTICYDLRFPGLFRSLAQSGADILICPAAFTRKTGELH
jgi:predicted amidohydrolase